MQSIQIKNNKVFKRKNLTLLSILLVVIAVGGVYIYKTTNSQPDEPRSSSQEDNRSTEDSGNNLQEGTINSGTGKPAANPDSNTTTNNEEISDDTTLVASITVANQNSDTLQIRTIIEEVLNNGACTLTLTNGDLKVTKSAAIQALPSSSTCQGFDVATHDLSPGDWTATIDISAGDKKAHLEKIITIN